MSKKLLIETRMNSLSLCEGVQSKHPGCLGTLKGPCADFINPTRNRNFYSRKLWENVFNDDLVKESLRDRVLIGELDHPGDRLETKATNACIVMTDYSFNDSDGVLEGTFDILDTPNGRILKSLLDYGCKIGVSSRGEGDVTESQGVNNVDEEGYYFVAFDAVVLPAVQKAKPTLHESLQRQSLRESLESQIKSASTKSELDLIKRVVEATEMPESDSLLESIDNRSRELEGVNDSSNLMEDLERSTVQNDQLLAENKRLKIEVANCKSRVKRFLEARIKSGQREDDLSEQVEKLTEQYSDAVFRLAATHNSHGALSEEMKSLSDRVSQLSEELRISRDAESQLSREVSNLNEALKKAQSSSQDKSRTISSLREEVRTITTQLSESRQREAKLRESVQSYKKSLDKSSKVNESLLKSYAEKRSKDLGISSKRVVESLRPGMKMTDVDHLLDEEVSRTDRYRNVPSSGNDVLSVLSEGTVRVNGQYPSESEEDSQTRIFMEQFYKNN